MQEGRKRLSKAQRMMVYQKYDGHCAYCGKKIEYKDMQVDHIESVYTSYLRGRRVDNSLENLMPACRACNYYKRTSTIEDFRSDIQNLRKQLERSFDYRMAKRYGLVEEHPENVKFYFEQHDPTDPTLI